MDLQKIREKAANVNWNQVLNLALIAGVSAVVTSVATALQNAEWGMWQPFVAVVLTTVLDALKKWRDAPAPVWMSMQERK